MTDPGYPQWERRYLDRKSATYVLAGAVRDLSDIAAIARGMADGS